MQPTPKPDALQRYGADLSDFAYSQVRVRKMLNDAHAHYEAQVRPMSGMAHPDADVADQVLGAMASAGKVARLTAKVVELSALLAKESDRNDALGDARIDAMASAGKVTLMTAELTKAHARIDSLVEALQTILYGTRLDAHGNRNDDGLVDHGRSAGFEKRIGAARAALLGAIAGDVPMK